MGEHTMTSPHQDCIVGSRDKLCQVSRGGEEPSALRKCPKSMGADSCYDKGKVRFASAVVGVVWWTRGDPADPSKWPASPQAEKSGRGGKGVTTTPSRGVDKVSEEWMSHLVSANLPSCTREGLQDWRAAPCAPRGLQ